MFLLPVFYLLPVNFQMAGYCKDYYLIFKILLSHTRNNNIPLEFGQNRVLVEIQKFLQQVLKHVFIACFLSPPCELPDGRLLQRLLPHLSAAIYFSHAICKSEKSRKANYLIHISKYLQMWSHIFGLFQEPSYIWRSLEGRRNEAIVTSHLPQFQKYSCQKFQELLHNGQKMIKFCENLR